MKRPTVVKRKLLREEWLVSSGKYQGKGESTARSFSQITFRISSILLQIFFSCWIEGFHKEKGEKCDVYLKPCKLQSFKAFFSWPYVWKAISNFNLCLSPWKIIPSQKQIHAHVQRERERERDLDLNSLVIFVLGIKGISHTPLVSSKTLARL